MITRRDVALRAGVSVTVVSRALTGHGYVKKSKRDAVLKAAYELGYQANPIALSLQRKRTNQILFYCKNLGNMYNIEMYRGMVQFATAHNHMVMMSGSLGNDKLRNLMVDGIIFVNEYDADYYTQENSNYIHLPIVAASTGIAIKPPAGVVYVESDVYAGMIALIRYLRKLGHSKIALATPYRLHISQPRHLAFCDEMACVYQEKLMDYVYSLEMDQYMPGSGEEDFKSEGEKVAEIYFNRRGDATAIICFNDEFALGMIQKLQQLRIYVPKDISIAGFDGVFVKRFWIPDLTTVEISPYYQGEECVRVLLRMLSGEDVPRITHISNNMTRIHTGETVNKLK